MRPPCALVLVVLLCSCGASQTPAAVAPEPESNAARGYDMAHPTLDSVGAAADGLLLLAVFEEPAQRQPWLDALARYFDPAAQTPCAGPCQDQLVLALGAQTDPSLRLTRSGRDFDQAYEAVSRGDADLQERAAFAFLLRAYTAQFAVLGADDSSRPTMLAQLPLCDTPLDPFASDFDGKARACASGLGIGAPGITDAPGGAITLVFAKRVADAATRVREGTSRLARTLQADRRLEIFLQGAPRIVMPMNPSWVSTNPLVETEEGETGTPAFGRVVHVRGADVMLRDIPSVAFGDAIPASFPPAVLDSPEAWADARERAHTADAATLGLFHSESEVVEEETPEWLVDDSDSEQEHSSNAHAIEGEARQDPMASCVGGFSRDIEHFVTLIVDQDASPEATVAVLRRLAETPTEVSWMTTRSVRRFSVGPAGQNDCTDHLDLSSTLALREMLTSANGIIVLRP